MEPHSQGRQHPPHSAFGRAFFLFSLIIMHLTWRFPDLHFLASKTCLGKKHFLTTVALFAIDISIPSFGEIEKMPLSGEHE